MRRGLHEVTVGERRTHWILVELRNLANPILAGIVSVFVTIWSTYLPDDAWGWRGGLPFLVVAVAFTIFWAVAYFTFLRPRYSELARDLAETQAERDAAQHALHRVLEAALAYLLNDIRADSSDTRVSAYSVEDDRFVLLTRHSPNPTFDKRGRDTYPLEQGVIGQAWARSSAHRVYDVENRDEWEEVLVNSGEFTPDEASALTMFSRNILAIRIDHGPAEKVGMLVIESQRADAFKESDTDRVRRRPLCSAVGDLIRWHEHFPRAKDWHDERNGRLVAPRLDEPAWKSSPATK